MPRPRKDLDQYRDEIERRIDNHHTQAQIRRWLTREGILISKNTLSTRIVAWQASRRTRIAATDPELISAIETAFHTTQYDDQRITNNITTQGLPTTANQVQVIRLAHGWHRRGNDNDQVANLRSQTFILMGQALNEGVARCYDRGLLRTYLRVKYHHHAREDDVRDALAQLNIEGTKSRRKGPNKQR
jgi:hypothetical protein